MKSATILTVVLAAMTASATDYAWVGGTSGSWGEPTNWEPNGVPTSGDIARFTGTAEEPSSAVTVSLDGNRAISTFYAQYVEKVTFTGGTAKSQLNVHQDMKGTLGSPMTFDKDVYVCFQSGKQWNNGTATEGSLIEFKGGVGTVAMTDPGRTPLLAFGTYTFDGPLDFSAGFRASSATIDLQSDVSGVKNTLTFSGGTFAPTGKPINGMPARITGSPTIGGTAPLAFNCGGEKPDMVINQWANVAEPIYRTFPVSFSWYSLCSSAGAVNNASVGFLPGSGSHLELTGDVTSVAARDFSNPVGDKDDHGSLRFAFWGCGANVLITGSKDIQAVGPNSTTISHADGVGYNTFEIGAGTNGLKTVRPFGKGAIYANDGHGIFIRAREPGLTLDNGLSYGNSVNNRNGYTFGFDGTNAMTLSGRLDMGTGTSKFPQLAEASLTLTGTINPAGTALDFVGTGDVILDSTTTIGGTTGRVSKHSSGTMTLRGTMTGSSYNKGYFAGGRTVLDYTVNECSRLNTASYGTALADALRLRGTELVLKGGSFAESVGASHGTTFQNGFTRIRREGGSSTIYLGKLSPNVTASAGTTGVVDFDSEVATVNAELIGKTLTGNVTVDGSKFAAVDEEGRVVAAPDSVATTIDGSLSIGRQVQNYIIIEPTEDGQSLTFNGTSDGAFVAKMNGMIFRGDCDYTISGGWIAGENTYGGALNFCCAGTGTVSYDGKLDRYGFTKTGPGTFRHTGTSNLSQSLNVYEGVFEVASSTSFSPASKSGYAVYLDGGTLRTSVDVELQRPINIGDNGGVIETTADTVFTVSANVQTATIAEGSSGPLVKKGSGTLLLANSMTAQSEVDILEGTVKLGHEWGLGCSTNSTRAIAPTKIKGGTLDVAGCQTYLGNVTLRGGSVIDTSEEKTGSLGAYTFWAENGTVAVPLTNVANPCKNNIFVANNLEKVTSGTVMLTAANTFTGTAFVREGTLDLTGSLAGSAWIEGGVLTGTGTIDGYVYVTADGTLAPKAGATMTLGDHLAIGEGGTLRIAANASGAAKVKLTKGNVYLGKDARLEFDLTKGGVNKLNGSVVVELPEGAKVDGTFANFVNGKYTDAAGNTYTISYTAGDGNDIAVSARGSGFSIIIH